MIAVNFELPYLTLAGIRVRISASTSANDSDEKKPPLTVLALHGWLDNAASFQPVIRALQEQAESDPTAFQRDIDFIALDFAGHGHSQHRPLGAWYYFTEYVADVATLIDSQEWSNVHLVGHSMGGYVAQMLAAVKPDQVQQLTVIEAMGLWLGTEGNLVTHLQKALAHRSELRSKAAPCYKDLQRLVKMRAELNDLSLDLARLLIERSVAETPLGFQWRVDPRVRLASPIRFTEMHAVDMLKSIKCPMQVILGDRGHENLLQAVNNWQQYVQNFSQITIQGGHHAHMQEPEVIARILADCAR